MQPGSLLARQANIFLAQVVQDLLATAQFVELFKDQLDGVTHLLVRFFDHCAIR
jgi:hypothetical protein